MAAFMAAFMTATPGAGRAIAAGDTAAQARRIPPEDAAACAASKAARGANGDRRRAAHGHERKRQPTPTGPHA